MIVIEVSSYFSCCSFVDDWVSSTSRNRDMINLNV